MKIDPGFIKHWKTEKLLDELGGDGLVVLFRIWGQAQIKREWKGLTITPKRLALETKWKGDENHLFSVLTDPEAPWLDKNEDGTYDIHGFEEHQKQVIHLWKQGGKGGRPKKEEKPNTKDNNKEDTYSSSYSYPISEPYGNQMVISPINYEELSRTNPHRYATFEQIKAYAKSQPMPISDECIEGFFDKMDSNGFTCDKGFPLHNWRGRFRTYATNWINNNNNPKFK